MPSTPPAAIVLNHAARGHPRSDPEGFGVVATRRLEAGETLVCASRPRPASPNPRGGSRAVPQLVAPTPWPAQLDWSVFFVARPPDYALAHLPPLHALEFGREGYFLLREPALGLSSLTYYVNEARGTRANVAYKVVRPRGGGAALGLHVLEPIQEGGELLAQYDQRVL